MKTVPATKIILGHNTADEFISKSLCEAVAHEREGVCVANFTSMGVKVARDTRAIVSIQGRALDPGPFGDLGRFS